MSVKFDFEKMSLFGELANKLLARQKALDPDATFDLFDINGDNLVTEEELIQKVEEFYKSNYELLLEESISYEEAHGIGYALNTTLVQDLKILYQIRKSHEKVRDKLGDHIPADNPNYQKELARHLFNYMTDREGLNIEPILLDEELTTSETIDEKRAACTEFTYTLLKIYRLAGLKAIGLNILENEDGASFYGSSGHTAVGLIIEDEIVHVDLHFSTFDARHKKAVPILPDQLQNIFVQQKGRYENKDTTDKYTSKTDADLYFDKAMKAKKSGNSSKSETLLKKAIQERDDFLEARIELGNIYCNYLVEDKDADWLAKIESATLFLRKTGEFKNRKGASDIFNRAKAFRMEANFHFAKRQHFLETSEAKKANKAFQAAMLANKKADQLYNPNNSISIEALGDLYFKEGQFKKAILEYKMALLQDASDSSKAKLHAKKGLANFYLKDNDKAKQSLMDALNLDYTGITTLLNQYAENGNRFHKDQLLKLWERFFPKSLELYIYKGYLLIKTGEFERAASFFDDLLTHIPLSDRVRYLDRIRSYFGTENSMGDKPEAEKMHNRYRELAYKAAIQIEEAGNLAYLNEEKNRRAIANLAVAFESNFAEKQKKLWLMLTKVSGKGEVRALTELGRLFANEGLLETAEKFYKKAARGLPDDQKHSPYYRMGGHYADAAKKAEGDKRGPFINKAIELLNKSFQLVQFEPNTPGVINWNVISIGDSLKYDTLSFSLIYISLKKLLKDEGRLKEAEALEAKWILKGAFYYKTAGENENDIVTSIGHYQTSVAYFEEYCKRSPKDKHAKDEYNQIKQRIESLLQQIE